MSIAISAGAYPFSVKIQIHRKAGVELRRFVAPRSFDELQSIAAHLWGSASPRLAIEYLDDEGDRIRMSSEDEWEECVRLFQQTTAARPGAPLVLHLSRQPARAQRAEGAGSSSDDEGYNRAPHTSASCISAAVPASSSVSPARGGGNMWSRPSSAYAAAPAAASNPSAPASVSPSPQRFPTANTTVAAVATAQPPLAPIATPTPAPAPHVPQLKLPEQPQAELSPTTRTAPPLSARFAGSAEPQNALIALLSDLFSCDAEAMLRDTAAAAHALASVVITRSATDDEEVCVDIDREKLLAATVSEGTKRIQHCDHVRAERLMKTATGVFALPADAAKVYYVLAAANARQTKVEEAFAALQRAVENGFDDADRSQRDTDFIAIRGDARFTTIVRTMRANRNSGPAAASPPSQVATTPAPAPIAPLPSQPTAPAAAAEGPPLSPRSRDKAKLLMDIFPIVNERQAAALLKASNWDINETVSRMVATGF